MRLLWHHRVPQHTAVKESWDLRVTVESSLRKNTGKLLVSGESLVLFSHSKDLKQQTTVTARSQLSFIWQAKESTSSRCEGEPTPKERPRSILTLYFYMFVFSPPWACHMQIGLAKKGLCLFHLKFSLWSMDFLLFHCSIFRGFSLSLSFSHCHFWLLFWSEVLILMRVIY